MRQVSSFRALQALKIDKLFINYISKVLKSQFQPILSHKYNIKKNFISKLFKLLFRRILRILLLHFTPEQFIEFSLSPKVQIMISWNVEFKQICLQNSSAIKCYLPIARSGHQIQSLSYKPLKSQLWLMRTVTLSEHRSEWDGWSF